MLKKLMLTLAVFVCFAPWALAEYPSDVTVLDKGGISRLTDEQLIDAYENTVVELDASRMFHTTSGFSPKEYKDFKDLLKYRLELLVEIHSRNLELPQF